MANLLLFANNAKSTLLSNVGPTDTAITLPGGEGARFPNPIAGTSFMLTIEDSLGNVEVVEVTGRAVDVLTVVRGREGTVARAFTVGTVVEARVTAGMLSYLDWQTPKNTANGPLVLDGTGKAPIETFDTPLQVYGDNRWHPKLDYAVVQQGTGIGQTAETLKLGWSAGSKLKATVTIAGVDTDEGAVALESWVTGTATAFKAATLATPRNLSATGPVTIAAKPFDGSADVAFVTAIEANALSIAMTNGLQAALDGRLLNTTDSLNGNLTLTGTGVLTAVTVQAPTIKDTSDERVKENIVPMALPDAIAIVRGTHPIRYFNTLTGRTDFGLGAQTQRKATPEIVHEDEETGQLAVGYQRLVAPLSLVVAHLLERVEALEAERDAAG